MSRIRRYGFLTMREQEALHHRDVMQLTFREIARRMGVTAATARRVYRDAKSKLQDVSVHGEEALSPLPKRVREVVADYFGRSRSALRAAIQTERLHWNPKQKCACFEGELLGRVGAKTWRMLNEWAGLHRPIVLPRRTAKSRALPPPPPPAGVILDECVTR